MKKLLLLLLLVPGLVLAQPKQNPGVVYDAVITRVTDGDTVVIAAPYLPAPLRPELAVRIWGVDTPEKGALARCAKERAQAQQATKFVKQAVAQSADRRVTLYGWDKYGGRVLGDIVLDGQSLRGLLIEQGLAREYRGGARRSWCQ